MTLYEIEYEMTQCVKTDPDGNVLDIDLERLNALQMERSRKLEGTAYWIKNLRSDLDQVEKELDRLGDIRDSLKRRIRNMTDWLKISLDGEKIKTPTLSVYQTTRDKTEVFDLDSIPEQYRKYTWKPDLTGIKDAISSGEYVPGAEVVKNTSLVIK